MRVALVNQAPWPWWNIELATLIAVLRQEGHGVDLVDLAFIPRGHACDSALRQLRVLSPDVVIIGAESGFEELMRVVTRIRDEFGTIPLVVGSMLPTFDKGVLKRLREAHLNHVWTFDVDANSEVARFLDTYRQGGISQGSHIVSAEKNPNSLPVPDFRPFDMPRYFKSVHTLTGNMPIYASEGCSYHCSFCNRKATPYMPKAPRRILEEILLQETRHRIDGMSSVVFHDNAFGLHKGSFNELMGLLRQEGIHERLPWGCQTRPELVTKAWAQDAARSGCFMVSLGLEMGVENIRHDFLNRRHTNAQFRQAVANLREAGIIYKFDLLVGLPMASLLTDFRSLLIALSCRPAAIYISPYCPIEGTSLGDHVLAREEAPSIMARSQRRAFIMKLLSLSPAVGIAHHGHQYIEEGVGVLLNLDSRRCLPLIHKLTTNHLFHRPVFDLHRKKYVETHKLKGGEVK